jgi:hypothetical protein
MKIQLGGRRPSRYSPWYGGKALKRLYVFLVVAAACRASAPWVDRGLFAPAARGRPPQPASSSTAEATSEQVHQVCGACHAYPPPDTFQRASSRREVRQGYDFLRDSALDLEYPSLESVVRYYESRAPSELTSISPRTRRTAPAAFRAAWLPRHRRGALPAVANVNLAHLFDRRRLDALTCDMRSGQIGGAAATL